MAQPQKKPLIPTEQLSEFGELPNSAEFNDATRMDRDHSYVPGFSEMRRNFDLKLAEVRQGVAPLSELQALQLPVNLRWAKSHTIKGNEADTRKQFAHARRGYRLVTKQEHEGQPWLTQLPPGTHVQADGSIRNGDCTLMWCTKEQASKNEAYKRRLTQERLHGVTEDFAQKVKAAGGTFEGADPTITKNVSDAPVQRGPGRPRKEG